MIGIVIGIIGVFVALVGIVVMVLIPLLQSRSRKKRILKSYFKLIWKKSSSLKHGHLLETRPYDPYYLERDEDELIRKSISAGSNVMILGPPLSGKTRAAYEALTKLNKPCDVLIAKNTDINPQNFVFPKHFKFWRPKILVIDDLHRLVELQNFDHLFRVAEESGTAVIATCRSGFECKKAKKRMTERGIDFETIFDQNAFELGGVSETAGQQAAKEAGIDWAKVRFNGMVGSVFMRLSEMEKRFNECDDLQKTILRTLRSLYFCGIYEENQVFPMEWVKTAAKREGLEGKDFQWTAWLESLRDAEFITLGREAVKAEEVYLEDVVRPEPEMEALHTFERMLCTFSGIPDALAKLGNRAYFAAFFSFEPAKYIKTAIKAYDKAVRVYTVQGNPTEYGVIQSNLGAAYGTLSDMEDKTANCRKAVKAFDEAIRATTLQRSPLFYAMIQNNLGATYRKLAETEAHGKVEYCEKAIEAFQQALKVYTPHDFPIPYAMTHNNLGNAYGTLAAIEHKAHNCKMAIKAYEKGMGVTSLARSPIEYATLQSNLGNAYRLLAEAEDKLANCNRAITAYHEALKIRTLQRFPMEYALTQTNLGNAYRTVAEVKDKAENCRRAINAYEEALKVYTEKNLPEPYQLVQGNIENLLDFCEGG